MDWFEKVNELFWDDRDEAQRIYEDNAPIDWADWEQFERNKERNDGWDYDETELNDSENPFSIDF